jgi:NADH-quinone oxidoreductase subunit G
MINAYINGILFQTNKNITILEACHSLNIEIPKFCFQENLKIAGNCRMCLVELENSIKPVASCAMPLANNMKIYTNTPLVEKARESVLEFLLINHPLDCPICDQASECDLQDQTLVYGSDKSRFFFFKRSVENKNCGPFIKTIMTRCIHCTRCVRFINEISENDNLGMVGRGNKSEISFYLNNHFTSLFSGNLIDLCPVGALTSKPYSFKVRSWELKKKEGIDILDGLGSNINIDVYNNQIIRILPKNNFNINKEWISDKTRFFFDSLKYQRIENPLLKINNKFIPISWYQVINIIYKKIIKYDTSQIKILIGNLIDLKSFYFLKKILNLIGINSNNLLFLNSKNNNYNNDLSSFFLFNSKLKNLNEYDLCLIINSNILKEASILNIYLLNRLKKGNFEIATIGPKINYIFQNNHLGNNLNILYSIILGKHFYCKKIKKAKNPLIIIGNNIILNKNNYYLIKKLYELKFLSYKNINFLSPQTSILNFSEINFSKSFFNKNNNYNLLFLYNTDFKQTFSNKYTIYIGHHFTQNAQNSNLIIPIKTFLEKKGLYINIEGFIQKMNVFLNIKNNQHKDLTIFNILYLFIKKKNQKKIFNSLNFNIIYNYLLKKKIKNIKLINLKKENFFFNLNFLNYYNKNLYQITILEKYSKLLMNSKQFLKKKINNFKL